MKQLELSGKKRDKVYLHQPNFTMAAGYGFQQRGADRNFAQIFYDLQIANCKAAIIGGNLLRKNSMKNLLLKITIKVGVYVRKCERVIYVHRFVYRYDSAVRIHSFVMCFATGTLFYIFKISISQTTCHYINFLQKSSTGLTGVLC